VVVVVVVVRDVENRQSLKRPRDRDRNNNARLDNTVNTSCACAADVAYGVRYYEKSVHSHGRSDE
jgi:hypothetical protein